MIRAERSIYRHADSKMALYTAYEKQLAAWPVPYAEQTIPTSAGATHILLCGPQDAPPLLLIHGAGVSATMWRPNIADLSARFRCILVDTLGDVGKSAPVFISRRNPKGYAEWLCQIMDALGINQSHVCGISLGGWIALATALYAPQRVKRLVTICPGSGIARLRAPFLWSILKTGFALSDSSVISFVRYLSSPASPPNAEFIAHMSICFRHYRNRLELPRLFSCDELKRITVPTLFLTGRDEVVFNVRRALARAKKCMPHIETCVIANAGHIVTAEQPDLVNREILAFLSKTP